MKNYRITVNGTTYDVAVEEGTGSAAAAPVAAAPAAAPAPKAAPAPAAPAPKAASGSAGSVTVASPMPGKILGVKTEVGKSVKKGEVLMILEAMKMENEIFATASGKVAEIRVNSGDSVNTGDVLLVIA